MESMKSLTITYVAIGLAILATAQQASTPVNEVRQLYTQDQADRGVGTAKSLPWEQIDPRDRSRRIRVHELLESNQLKTAEDFHDAAFIYQHGHDPEDYLLAHILAMVAVQKGDTRAFGFLPRHWIATYKRSASPRFLALSTTITTIRPTRRCLTTETWSPISLEHYFVCQIRNNNGRM